MNKIRKYLSQRYPQQENSWKLIISISLFIEIFIVIFQPFGLSELGSSYKYLLLSGYGLVTFIVLVFNLLLLPALFPKAFKDDEHWTVIKEILFLVWILFTVGLGNLLYSSWTMGFLLTLHNTLIFQAYTLAIGIIPITVLTLLKQNYLKRKNEENAGLISSTLNVRKHEVKQGQQVNFTSDNEKEGLMLDVCDILFVKSDGNYITVGYLKNGKLSRALLRITMKNATELLTPFPFLFQCHRSWIVNMNNIVKVTGNSQGLRISIESYEEDIPVARNNTSIFRQRISGMEE